MELFEDQYFSKISNLAKRRAKVKAMNTGQEQTNEILCIISQIMDSFKFFKLVVGNLLKISGILRLDFLHLITEKQDFV